VHRQRGDEHDDLDQNLGEIDAGQNSKGYHTAPPMRAATRLMVSSNRSASAGVVR
jgi:hypothetical protein